MTPAAHPLDHALQLQPLDAQRWLGSTSPHYRNLIGPFGGITTAQLLQAVLLQPNAEGTPISQTVNFAAPIADGSFEIGVRALRINRSTQHWLVELTQQDQVAASCTVVLAQRRPSWSSREAPAPQDLPPPDQLPRFAQPALPPWVQRYDMRFVHGSLPETFDGMEQEEASSLLWIRDEPARPLDFPALAALGDSMFPRIFLRRRTFSPIGTISLTVHFHADAAQLQAQGDRPVVARGRALNYREGFFDQSAELWSDHGHLLAASHQMVYFR